MKKTFLGFTTLILAACTMQSPVTGITSKSERFDGTATRTYPSSSGVLNVTSNKGVTCTGEFRYLKTGNRGGGNFSCTDGRTGTYKFVASEREGHGVGTTTNGEDIEFFFSKPRL